MDDKKEYDDPLTLEANQTRKTPPLDYDENDVFGYEGNNQVRTARGEWQSGDLLQYRSSTRRCRGNWLLC